MGSDFLFAMPSLVTGAARTLDLGATLDSYNESQTPEEADQRPLAADWAAVGKDLLVAMRNVDEERPEPSQLALQLVEE